MLSKKLLTYLYEAEGGKVHYNKGEVDITSPGGIYRKSHPNARIFVYIDSVAKNIGITSPSKLWGKKTLRMVNRQLDMDRVDILLSRFYNEFLESAHLEEFPTEATVMMYSLYINSPKRAWKAVQQAIRDMVQSRVIISDLSATSTVDGVYGRKTANMLALIDADEVGGEFKMYIASAMKTQYIKLALARPKKFMRYLKGWDNRVNKLATI